MHIDYKCTVWRRIHIPDDKNNREYILEKLKKGTEPLLTDAEYETLYDTSEEITPEDNDGCSTIEAYDEDRNIIFKNGKD
tara:strand:+ start:1193 stop:1432 length:240 start_codon:yes stop_codon:yes gene_type:complete